MKTETKIKEILKENENLKNIRDIQKIIEDLEAKGFAFENDYNLMSIEKPITIFNYKEK